MNWHAALGIIGGLIQLGAVIPYIRDIFKGSTRPNVVSFIIWFLLGLIELFAQLSAGVSWPIVITFAIVFNTALAVVLCLFGYGYKQYEKVDFISLGIGLVALVVWAFTHRPVLALVLTMVASIFAAIPTIVKAHKDPHSEEWFAWLLVFIASLFAITSTYVWDVANLIVPAFNLVEGLIISSLAFYGQKKH